MRKRKLARNIYKLALDLVRDFQGLVLAILFSSYRAARLLNRVKRKSQGCMVLGNGPSLKGQLEFIKANRKEYDVLGVNFFCNSDAFWELKPDLYCIADPVVFNSSDAKDIIQQRVDQFVANFNAIDWDCFLFYPVHFNQGSILESIDNSFVKKTPYNSVPVSGKSYMIHCMYSLGLAMPTPESVIIPAIYLPLTLGFRKLILFGTDHSWISDFKVKADNSSSFCLDHFTGKEIDTQNDRSVSEFMLSQYRLFHSHDCLRWYADFKNCDISNATIDSFIDVYKKGYNL